MSGNKINRMTPMPDLLRARETAMLRMEVLVERLQAVERLLRQRVARALWGYEHPPHADLDDAESGIREQFPELRELLGFRTYRETARWVLGDNLPAERPTTTGATESPERVSDAPTDPLQSAEEALRANRDEGATGARHE